MNWLKILRFLSVLSITFLIFHAILRLEPFFGFLQSFIASNVRALLLISGFEVVQKGYFLFLMNHGLEVAPACVGWRSLLAFAGLLLATPGRKDYFRGLWLVPVIYGFNLFRLGTSFLVSIFFSDWFGLVHGFLWTQAMTLLVLGLWWFWIKLRVD